MTTYPDSASINDALRLAFAETNQEVYKMVADVRFSGSTCTSILTYGRKVYCANVGDSRTILIRAGPQGQGKERSVLCCRLLGEASEQGPQARRS